MQNIDRLLDIMRGLRDPDRGCPWDKEQSFESIAPYTVEEAYEVADAITRGAMDDLLDELGDLLFQVVFHAQMATEKGLFSFEDVVGAVIAKMVRRHPHVFGDSEVGSAEEQTLAWEEHKRLERIERGEGNSSSILDGVGRGLPALLRAEKLQRRAARVGFDWGQEKELLPVLGAELKELGGAIEHDADGGSVADEFGDLVFSCINLARHLGIDTETALRNANDKFERRFRRVEHILEERGVAAGPQQRSVMEQAWKQAKREGL